MTTPSLHRLLLAAALLSAPAAPGAIDWAARAGLDYTRIDTWPSEGAHATYPRLDLNLNLDASGFIVAPGILSWSLGGQYQRIATSGDALDTTRDVLSYRGRASVLRAPSSPFNLELFANRQVDDYSTGGADGEASISSSQVGATASLAMPYRPSLDLGYSRSDREQRGPLWVDSDGTVQTVTAASHMGSSAFTYLARYRGNFSEGTFDSDNYDAHRVDLNASASMGPGTEARITDTWYLRTPTRTAATNPHQEANSFSASVRLGAADSAYQQYGYRYSHALRLAPLAADVERANQRLDYTSQWRFGTAWRLRARADVAMLQDRLGTVEERSTGETVGAVVYWRRGEGERSLELRGGPSVGLLQPVEGGNELGYGATAGVTWRRRFDPWSTQANYDARYGSGLHGTPGWTFTQSGSASIDRRIENGTLSATLIASAHAADSPLYGPIAGRQLNATGRYRYGAHSAFLTATLSSNFHGELDESLTGDGIFIPPGYDSHARNLTAGGHLALTRQLSTNAQVRIGETDLPDRPTSSEVEARGDVTLAYGALQFSLEDRFLMTRIDGKTGRQNLVMLRLSRVFGSRY